MWNIFNCQIGTIDEDDYSSSIRNDCFQLISRNILVLFDNIFSVPKIPLFRAAGFFKPHAGKSRENSNSNGTNSSCGEKDNDNNT